MRRPQPAKLSNNANFDHTPSTRKPWQVSMVRRREDRQDYLAASVPDDKRSALIVCAGFSAYLDADQTLL